MQKNILVIPSVMTPRNDTRTFYNLAFRQLNFFQQGLTNVSTFNRAKIILPLYRLLPALALLHLRLAGNQISGQSLHLSA